MAHRVFGHNQSTLTGDLVFGLNADVEGLDGADSAGGPNDAHGVGGIHSMEVFRTVIRGGQAGKGYQLDAGQRTHGTGADGTLATDTGIDDGVATRTGILDQEVIVGGLQRTPDGAIIDPLVIESLPATEQGAHPRVQLSGCSGRTKVGVRNHGTTHGGITSDRRTSAGCDDQLTAQVVVEGLAQPAGHILGELATGLEVSQFLIQVIHEDVADQQSIDADLFLREGSFLAQDLSTRSMVLRSGHTANQGELLPQFTQIALRIGLYLPPIRQHVLALTGRLETYLKLCCSYDIAGPGFLRYYDHDPHKKLYSVSSINGDYIYRNDLPACDKDPSSLGLSHRELFPWLGLCDMLYTSYLSYQFLGPSYKTQTLVYLFHTVYRFVGLLRVQSLHLRAYCADLAQDCP